MVNEQKKKKGLQSKEILQALIRFDLFFLGTLLKPKVPLPVHCQPAAGCLPGYVRLSFFILCFFSSTLARLRYCFLTLEWLAGWQRTRVCPPGTEYVQHRARREAGPGVCFLADRPSLPAPLPSHHHLNQAASHLLLVFPLLPHHDTIPPTSLISPLRKRRVSERRGRYGFLILPPPRRIALSLPAAVFFPACCPSRLVSVCEDSS